MNSFILTHPYTPPCLPAGTARRGIIGIHFFDFSKQHYYIDKL